MPSPTPLSPMTNVLSDAYEHSHQDLQRVAARYVGRDAEDLVQDAFVRALQSGDAFRYESAPATWLHRIVVNTCIDRWRRQRRRQHIETPVASIETASGVAADHDPLPALLVRRALQGLPAEDQRICILYYIVGLSHRELAAILGIPVSTSKTRLHVARGRLRQPFTRVGRRDPQPLAQPTGRYRSSSLHRRGRR